MSDTVTLGLTGLAFIICIADAVLCWKIFHRFRRSWAARGLIIGFISLALCVLVAFLNVLGRTQGVIFQQAGMVVFGFFLIGVFAWLVSLLDFKRHL